MEDNGLEKPKTAAGRKRTVSINNEKWKNAVLNGDFSGRNLHFLLEIINNFGVSRTQFAEMIGCKVSALNYWVLNDDCHLSRLQNSFRNMGYELTCELSVNEDSPLKAETSEDIILKSMQEVFRSPKGSSDSFTVTMPTITDTPMASRFGGPIGRIDENARLYFLIKVLREYSIKLKPFCRLLGLSYQKLFKNVQRDDMLISSLLEIARKGKMSVSWKLTPIAGWKKQDGEESEAGNQ